MSNIGLVLSGGGIRGMAHLGVLTALEELDIPISAISGVSAGAIIGALYSAGYSPEEILDIAKKESAFNLVKFVQSPGGLFSATGLKRILQTYIPDDSFEALRIPLFVTATDISSGISLTFSKGMLYDAIIGSASIPGLFTPILYDNHYLLDGGILNNFPVDCLKEKCTNIIGSHVNKIYNAHSINDMSRMAIVEKCFHLAIAHNIADGAKKCDVFIEPQLAGYTMFNMKQADEIYAIGYNETMDRRRDILNLLARNQITT